MTNADEFWDAVDAAYEALRLDPVTWQEELAERELWLYDEF